MIILVNASNLKVGGGLQVADSICRELHKYPHHHFVVVLPPALEGCAADIQQERNVEVVRYALPRSLRTVLTGRQHFLDHLVRERGVQAVLTVFGPSLWQPRCLHVCGFARPHLVLPDSPFFRSGGPKRRWRLALRRWQLRLAFGLGAGIYYTENSFISVRLKQLYPGKRVYTVTNNCNQVFHQPAAWRRDIQLPPFEGLTLLTISANYPHKNLRILPAAADALQQQEPGLRFRFVLTIGEEELGVLTPAQRSHFVCLGRVDISQCPPLYEQADIMLLPSLLECFSASYAEAMQMGVPIVTTDLGFAHSLCADAALYYDPCSPEALARAIGRLAREPELRSRLAKAGRRQLLRFDTFEERSRKLINIIEHEYQRYATATPL